MSSLKAWYNHRQAERESSEREHVLNKRARRIFELVHSHIENGRSDRITSEKCDELLDELFEMDPCFPQLKKCCPECRCTYKLRATRY